MVMNTISVLMSKWKRIDDFILLDTRYLSGGWTAWHIFFFVIAYSETRDIYQSTTLVVSWMISTLGEINITYIQPLCSNSLVSNWGEI